MGATLAPWPFLVGGAAAVEVALLLEGDVIEQRYLWRGGESEARDGSGILRVRASEDGFELLVHGVCDGIVTVGERAVSLRELALCGVVALPLGPMTTARLRLGATELRVAGTTAPAKLALLKPVRSARELATLAAGAVAALVCAVGLMATMAAPPRLLDWQLQYRAWMLRLSHGLPYEGTVTKFYAVAAPGSRQAHAARAAAAATNASEKPAHAAPAKDSAATAKDGAAPAKNRAATAAATSAVAKKQGAKESALEAVDGASRAAKEAPKAAEPQQRRAGSAPDASLQAPGAATAPGVGAKEARHAGIVAQLEHWHAGFLGDEHAFGDVEVPLSEQRPGDSRVHVDGVVDIVNAAFAHSHGGAAATSGASACTPIGSCACGGLGVNLDGPGELHASGGEGISLSGDGAGGSGRGASAGSTSAGSESGDPGISDGSGVGAAGDRFGMSGVIGVGSDETIGLGDLGTLGHGSGTGTGYGYGSAYGRLGGHTAAVVPDLASAPTIHGNCDAELIRRVVRAHVNEVRFCYERALQARPDLSGRVVARFDITPDGSAADAAIGSSTVADPTVAACVAGAIRRWQFPTCAATVSYPFVFVPGGD